MFIPEESSLYDFGICIQGTARLYIDGKLIVSNIEYQRSGPSFLGSGTMEMVTGMQYRILVQWGCAKTTKLKVLGTVDFGYGGFRFSSCMGLDSQQVIVQAAKLVETVDQAVLFAELSREWEIEGQDREHMELPPHTNELISKILEATNPNTAVAVQSGTMMSMP